MVAKAPWARLTLWEKCSKDAMLGMNQYPSHQTQARGGKISLSEHIRGGVGVPAGSIE